MTCNHCQVLLKCMFLLKLLNHSFCVCSINEHERRNILSFVAVLSEVQGFNHTVFMYMFILEKKLIFMLVFV